MSKNVTSRTTKVAIEAAATRVSPLRDNKGKQKAAFGTTIPGKGTTPRAPQPSTSSMVGRATPAPGIPNPSGPARGSALPEIPEEEPPVDQQRNPDDNPASEGGPPSPGGPPGPPGGGGNDDDDDNSSTPGDHDPNPPDDESAKLITALESISAYMANAPKPSAPTPKSHARKPDPFAGTDPHKLQPFLLQCELFFLNNQRQYSSNEDKVNFTLSYLTGTALEYFEPSIADGTLPDNFWYWNWDAFKRLLKETFGTIDPEGDAEDQLDRLRMRDNQRILKYNVEFTRLTSRVHWGDSALRHRYYVGLPDRIKDVLAQQPKPKTLTELREAAQLLDARHWERSTEQSRTEKATTSQRTNFRSGPGYSSTFNRQSAPRAGTSSSSCASGSGTPSSSRSTPASGNGNKDLRLPSISNFLGKDGKLKPEERQRRMDRNLCLRCGKSGHVVADCRPNSSASRARASKTEGKTSGSSGNSKN